MQDDNAVKWDTDNCQKQTCEQLSAKAKRIFITAGVITTLEGSNLLAAADRRKNTNVVKADTYHSATAR